MIHCYLSHLFQLIKHRAQVVFKLIYRPRYLMNITDFMTINRMSIAKWQFFKIIFGGHKFFWWGHWYPYFELLVTSPLGFKARVGSLETNLGYIYDTLNSITVTLFVFLYSVSDFDLPSQVGKGRFHSPISYTPNRSKSNKIIFRNTYERCSSIYLTCFIVTCIVWRKEDSSMGQVWRSSTPGYKKPVYWSDLGEVILLIYTVTNNLTFSWLSGTCIQHLITSWIINNSSEFLDHCKWFLDFSSMNDSLRKIILDDHVYHICNISENCVKYNCATTLSKKISNIWGSTWLCEL